MPDKHVALALVDPPYFSGPERRGFYGSEISTTKIQRRHYPKSEKWSVPGKEFFDELMRVSRKYVVFGCNYFDYHFHSGNPEFVSGPFSRFPNEGQYRLLPVLLEALQEDFLHLS